MKNVLIGTVIGLVLMAGIASSDILPSPAGIDDRSTLLYLRRIKEAFNNLEIITSEPNGTRQGRSGDIVIFNDSGTYRLRLNISTNPGGGTTWVSVTS